MDQSANLQAFAADEFLGRTAASSAAVIGEDANGERADVQ
jgi:hypothetical protein